MADIGELVIQIRASAEGVETAISGAMQSIQRFAAQVEASGSKVSFGKMSKTLAGDQAKAAQQNLQSVYC